MRCTRHVIAGFAVFRNVLVAADITQWMTEWSTTTYWSTKAAETMWNTEYSTTTCWSTLTPPPVYETITSSKTIYDTITSTTTLEVPYTTTKVVEKDFTTTLYSSYAQVVTSVATVTKVVVSTVTNVVAGKGYTSTIIIHNTETITQACFTPTPTLTGLVPCPSRITNEQGYVPPTPLPSSYLWGCPPGELCKPEQTGCNFEAGLYAATYICAPKDCIAAEQPPSYDQFGGPYAEDINSTCPFFETFDDYPLISPSIFGLDYNEFGVSSLGIAATSCPPAVPPPQPTTTTTSSPVYVPPPTTYSPLPPPASSSTTQWLPWTKSSSYAPPPSSSTWASWVPPAPVVSSSSWAEWAHSSSIEAYSSGWDGWSSTKTWSHGVTPRALAARAPAVTAPAICQKLCQYCAVQGEFVARNYNSLCKSGVPFQAAYSNCQSCINNHKTDQPKGVQDIITNLNIFLDVCSAGAPQTTPVSAPAVNVSPTTTPTVITSTVKPPPPTTTTTTKKVPPPTTTTLPTTSITTSTTQPITTASTTSITPPVITSTTSTTSSPPAPPAGGTSTGTLCLVSEFTDGQPQATSCAAGAESPTTTSANTSISSYSSGNVAQATQRPAAAMIIGVVVVIAMV